MVTPRDHQSGLLDLDLSRKTNKTVIKIDEYDIGALSTDWDA